MVQPQNSKKFINELNLSLATGLGFGYSPVAPGTVGSILAILIYWLLPVQYFLFYTILLLLVSFYIAGAAEKTLGQKDSQKIIIDELVGMSIVLLFVPPKFIYILLAFVFFRFFDISKFYPAKSIEKLQGGLGIVGDDILAGLYASLLIQIIILLF